MQKKFAIVLPLFLGLLAPFPVVAEDAELAKLFSASGVTGTIVLSSLDGDEAFVHNAERSAQQFPPASTFKILNTLISLEENVITDGAPIKWDGVTREIAAWNHDQTLESAFRASCVWCFQRFARKIGAAKYQEYIASVKYGRLDAPFDETEFWLDGSLMVSAMEQVQFLKKVYRRSLPFKSTSYASLRRIMVVDETPEFTLRGKTGWATSRNPQIGWYVGYIETSTEVWSFALNIDTHSQSDLPLRQKIVQQAFRAKSIIN